MGGGIDLASFFLFRWPTLVALTVIKITNSLYSPMNENVLQKD